MSSAFTQSGHVATEHDSLSIGTSDAAGTLPTEDPLLTQDPASSGERGQTASQLADTALMSFEELKEYTTKNATAFDLSAKRFAFNNALLSEREKLSNYDDNASRYETWNVMCKDGFGQEIAVPDASEETTRAYGTIRSRLTAKIDDWTQGETMKSVFDPTAHEASPEKPCAACSSILSDFLVPAADLGSLALSLRQAVRGSAVRDEDTFVDNLAECVRLVTEVKQVVHPSIDDIVQTKLFDDDPIDSRQIPPELFAHFKSVVMGKIAGCDVESILEAARHDDDDDDDDDAHLERLGFMSAVDKYNAVTEASARSRLGMMNILSRCADSQIPFYQVTDVHEISKAYDPICAKYKSQIDGQTQSPP